jgi:hypothetical protein
MRNQLRRGWTVSRGLTLNTQNEIPSIAPAILGNPEEFLLKPPDLQLGPNVDGHGDADTRPRSGRILDLCQNASPGSGLIFPEHFSFCHDGCPWLQPKSDQSTHNQDISAKNRRSSPPELENSNVGFDLCSGRLQAGNKFEIREDARLKAGATKRLKY